MYGRSATIPSERSQKKNQRYEFFVRILTFEQTDSHTHTNGFGVKLVDGDERYNQLLRSLSLCAHTDCDMCSATVDRQTRRATINGANTIAPTQIDENHLILRSKEQEYIAPANELDFNRNQSSIESKFS